MLLAASTSGCHASASSRPAPHTTARSPAPDAAGQTNGFDRAVWVPIADGDKAPPPAASHAIVCGDLSSDRCKERCAHAASPEESARCALYVRWGHDAEALRAAEALLAETGVVLGLETTTTMHGAHVGTVRVSPAFPRGRYQHHVDWITASIGRYERLFAHVSAHATRPVEFRTRPLGFRFYRTEHRSFPSAYAIDGVVGYNLEGELHTSESIVAATLFHELFHLNDQAHGDWSKELEPVFEAIVARCGSAHACFEPYAPDDTTVPGGTYYAFDRRTGSAREYAAEVALRWFREQETAASGAEVASPFKCAAEENARAWRLVVDEFFGGADLVTSCDDTTRGGDDP